MNFYMYIAQTILYTCVDGRTLEAYTPEHSDFVHWNRVRVGCLVMHFFASLSSTSKRSSKAQVYVDRLLCQVIWRGWPDVSERVPCILPGGRERPAPHRTAVCSSRPAPSPTATPASAPESWSLAGPCSASASASPSHPRASPQRSWAWHPLLVFPWMEWSPGGGWSHQPADWRGSRPSGSDACPHGEWVWRPCPPCQHEESPPTQHGQECLRETGKHS